MADTLITVLLKDPGVYLTPGVYYNLERGSHNPLRSLE